MKLSTLRQFLPRIAHLIGNPLGILQVWVFVLLIIHVSFVALTYLDMPIPGWHPGNDVVNTCGAMIRAKFGLDGVHVIPPMGSYPRFGVFSFLSAPMVENGYIEGGRLLAYFSIMVASLTLAAIAWKLSHSLSAVLLAAFLFWVNPYITWMSFSMLPATVSVAVGCLSVFLALHYVSAESFTVRLYLLFVLILTLGAGAMNHAWEAITLLPVTYVLLSKRRVTAALAIVTLTMTSLLLTIAFLAQGTDIRDHSIIQAYSVLTHAKLLATVDWWIPLSLLEQKGRILPTFHFWLGILLLVAASVRVWRPGVTVHVPHAGALKIASVWLLSGYALIFFFPRGYVTHTYYIWGLLAPISLLLALHITAIFSWFERRAHVSVLFLRSATMVAGMGALLIVILSFLITEAAAERFFPAWKERARTVGRAIRDLADQERITEMEVSYWVTNPGPVADLWRSEERKRRLPLLIYSTFVPVYVNAYSDVTEVADPARYPGPTVVSSLEQLASTVRMVIELDPVDPSLRTHLRQLGFHETDLNYDDTRIYWRTLMRK